MINRSTIFCCLESQSSDLRLPEGGSSISSWYDSPTVSASSTWPPSWTPTQVAPDLWVISGLSKVSVVSLSSDQNSVLVSIIRCFRYEVRATWLSGACRVSGSSRRSIIWLLLQLMSLSRHSQTGLRVRRTGRSLCCSWRSGPSWKGVQPCCQS